MRKTAPGVDQRVVEADTVVSAAEKMFGELTAALAELTASRNQLAAAIKAEAERIARFDSELANIEAGLGAAAESRPDLDAMAAAVETAMAAVTQAGEAAVAAEAGHVGARKSLEGSRQPLTDAERAVQRLETEAKTLMKLLAVETQSMWPPVMDSVQVEKGYELALGAAIGDDLEAPVDQTHAIRWMGAAVDPSDPALPEGAEPLSEQVMAPPELARRLNQIGVVASRADGARLVAPTQARPASRVSRRRSLALGRLCPPTRTRRPVQPAVSPRRSRLADIDGELVTRRAPKSKSARAEVETAQGALTAAAAAETVAREQARAAQRDADAARDLHAAAERDVARNAARISALTEAKVPSGRKPRRSDRRPSNGRKPRSPPCPPPSKSKKSSRQSTPRSKASAPASPKPAPRRRRSPAKPNRPTAASPPSRTTARPGATAATARRRRSRRSRLAARRPGSEHASLVDAARLRLPKSGRR